MSGAEKNNPRRQDDKLLKDLLAIGQRIGRQKYPGNAWQDAQARLALQASAGRGKFFRLILPALTAAAALIFLTIGISHLLNPPVHPTGIKVTRTPITVGQSGQTDEYGIFALSMPSVPEIAVPDNLEVAGSDDLQPPDTSLMSNNLSIDFTVPEISMPAAASGGIEWNMPSLTMPSI